MEEITVTAESVVKIEVKQEISEEYWEKLQYLEREEHITVKREVKTEDEEEELEPPVSVLIEPTKEEVAEENEDPLAMCGEGLSAMSGETEEVLSCPGYMKRITKSAVAEIVSGCACMFSGQKETMHYLEKHPEVKSHPLCKNNSGVTVAMLVTQSTTPQKGAKQKQSLLKRQHKCPFCHKVSFRYNSHLIDHIRTHTGEKPFECSICKNRFTWRGSLKFHIQSHNREIPMQKKFVFNQRIDTSDLWIECSICKRSFTERVTLNQKYPEAKPYKCTLCKNSLSGEVATNTNGVAPLQGKESTKEIKCAACKNTFANQKHFITHLLTHQSDNPFGCCVCKKSFKVHSSLLKHAKIHGEKPYECAICKKRFRERFSLVNHKGVYHNGDTQFECSICEKRYPQLMHLTVHMRNIHGVPSGDRQFECSICKRRFTKRCNLNVHMQTSHASNTLAVTTK